MHHNKTCGGFNVYFYHFDWPDSFIEKLYDEHQTTMSHDKSQFNIIMGDFNTKVGEGNGEACMGKF